MIDSLPTIHISSLLLMLPPVAVVILIQYKWSLNYKEGLYAVSRMLGQLLIVGYFLGNIFNADKAWIVILILIFMIVASSWISLRTVADKRKSLLPNVMIALLLGAASVLTIVTQGVLDFLPWYKPQYMIPLAGMIFANSLNSISLAAERYFEEQKRGVSYTEARNISYRAAMIPITNSLFAVGLVSIPGMMTGQILSGVDPLIAARYQIMVMAMIYASGGLSSSVFLYLLKGKKLL